MTRYPPVSGLCLSLRIVLRFTENTSPAGLARYPGHLGIGRTSYIVLTRLLLTVVLMVVLLAKWYAKCSGFSSIRWHAVVSWVPRQYWHACNTWVSRLEWHASRLWVSSDMWLAPGPWGYSPQWLALTVGILYFLARLVVSGYFPLLARYLLMGSFDTMAHINIFTRPSARALRTP